MLPVVSGLTTTNPMAVSDRIEGTLIIADSNTPNVTVTVEVAADPCPEVRWSVNGTTISENSSGYFLNNPCIDVSPPYNFTIIITNLTLATSGQYSAVFRNTGGSTTLPGLYVTVPGEYSSNAFSELSRLFCKEFRTHCNKVAFLRLSCWGHLHG